MHPNISNSSVIGNPKIGNWTLPINPLMKCQCSVAHLMNCFRHLFSAIASYSSLPSSCHSNSKPFIVKYLIDNLDFSEPLAFSISTRLSHICTPQKPDAVLCFLRAFGLSDVHIRLVIISTPQILVASPSKTLKPKLALFQSLGLSSSTLGPFLSKNSIFLRTSLHRKLLPCISILQTILPDNVQLLKSISRYKWILLRDPNSRLTTNISLLRHCGIVDSQLSMLLRRQPSLFVTKESMLRGLIERVKEMGISKESWMFVYALLTLSCLSKERLERKLEVFGEYGMERGKVLKMFQKAPNLFRTSEVKLRAGLGWFLGEMGCDLATLERSPTCLMLSLERRVVPRWKVIKILRGKGLLGKGPSLVYMMQMSEEEFLKKFILKFDESIEELLIAYRGKQMV